MSYFCFALIVYYLNVIFTRLRTSVGKERCFFCHRLLVIFVVSVRRRSSSEYMGKAALFYCGTPWDFHILITSLKAWTCLVLSLNRGLQMVWRCPQTVLVLWKGDVNQN